MTKKKEKKQRIVIGDVVEIQDARNFGMVRNTYRGVLIWRPTNQNEETPQFYAVWTWNRFSTREAEVNLSLLRNAFNRLPSDIRDDYWDTRIWKYMMDEENVKHILYVPKNYKVHIRFIEHETLKISAGDFVLDKRWFYRFGRGNVRRVLAVKKDEAYGEDRLCIENPTTTRYLGFYNWISAVLRKNVIKISKTKTMEMPIEEPEPKQTHLKNILIRRTA